MCIFFYDRTESAMNLNIWLYHIDIIMFHCNFLQVDLRTHESPLGPLSQAETLNEFWTMYESRLSNLLCHSGVNPEILN